MGTIGLGIGLTKIQRRRGMPPIDRSIFPNALAVYDMRMSTSEFSGGPQSLANVPSGGAGNMIAQKITSLNPTYQEKADGSIQTSSTTTAIRPLAGLGARINFQHTNALVSPRDFTNAAWLKDAGVAAAKTQIGRTGGANTCSLLTWTVNDAVVQQSVVVGSTARQLSMDAKRITGSDPLEWSLDGGATWSNFDFSNPRNNGIARTIKNDATLRTAAGMILRSKAGNSFLVDFANNCETTIGLGMEGDVLGSNVQAWHERYSCQLADNSPIFALSMENQWCFYLEWWQCKDLSTVTGIFRSDGHMNMSSDTTNGVTGGGLASTGIPRICPTRRDLFTPAYVNRTMFWRDGTTGKLTMCTNGNTPLTTAGAFTINGAATHFDLLTNGNQSATVLGAFDRFWCGRSIPTAAFAMGYTAVP